MATKKTAAAKPAAHKPITEALNKTTLIQRLAERTGAELKVVRAVLAELEDAIAASIHKKGVGHFTLPGLMKIMSVKVPAKPKRKGLDPFTKVERTFAAKPATVRVKVRPLKKLKAAAL